MRATATTFPRYAGRSSATAYRTFSKQSLLKRARFLVEFTDWDKMLIAQEKWINKICLGIAILSALYFAPVIVLSLLK